MLELLQPLQLALSTSTALCALFAGLLGLLVGSFLNVVIYRLPVMMQANWRKDCLAYLELPPEPEQTVFNLVWPSSHCPVCKAAVKPEQNIPVLSYLLLRGRCAGCGTPIPLRYPFVELLTAVLSGLVAWHFGYAPQTIFALLLTWCLVALSFIDIDHHLLPDSITLPMLWLGLLLSLTGLFTDTHASIIGAVAGYLVLWSVYQVFKLATGKEGMGFGDFKLLALLGAWLGWQALPLIVLLSSLVGSVLGITMAIFAGRDHTQPIPFGPYLAVAGWLALLWGDGINHFYLDSVGL